ncbi:MAG TPA: efflux RND transporter periplasmic adaptor subunit [Bacteroidota bacterium]|nr:efflux RND transporter periplasmic adaptor subunit [Bacteroidota bacterium]
MNKKAVTAIVASVVLIIAGLFFYPKLFVPKQERRILYWTDPMIAGDRSDHPGKSPMGMDRIPVYEDGVQNQPGAEKDAKAEYYCPMHPQVIRDKPGACNICGMTLVKKSTSQFSISADSLGLAGVVISPSRQILAQVATSVAKRVSMEKSISAAGRIDYAEPNFRHISTRFPGRVEKLYLTYTGQPVKKGDPVADLYSPEAISAQREYLLARKSFLEVKESPEMISDGARSLLDEAREKLLLWGFTGAQIALLDSTKEVKNDVTIYSPITGTVLKKNVDPQHYAGAGEDLYDVADLSTIWMVANAYEFDMQWLKLGQNVTATTDAYPGVKFSGAVNFISPMIDPATRTLSLRAEFSNPGDKLKPGMYVDAFVNVTLPPAVVVPATALLSTGTRTVVWVQKGPDIFLPRLVQPGARAGERVQILEGISEGERVVTSGGYLLDSESELQAGLSAAAPAEREPSRQ